MVNLVSKWTKYYGDGGRGNPQIPPQIPKIIAIIREPLERAWSSYNYNYVDPALTRMRKGIRKNKIPRGQTDEYYIKHFIYSFEDMISAELKILKACLEPGGWGETETKKMFERKAWTKSVYKQMEKQNSTLLDLDEVCYGERISPSVPRIQWKELVEEKPDRLINVQNLHLGKAY